MEPKLLSHVQMIADLLRALGPRERQRLVDLLRGCGLSSTKTTEVLAYGLEHGLFAIDPQSPNLFRALERPQDALGQSNSSWEDAGGSGGEPQVRGLGAYELVETGAQARVADNAAELEVYRSPDGPVDGHTELGIDGGATHELVARAGKE